MLLSVGNVNLMFVSGSVKGDMEVGVEKGINGYLTGIEVNI